MTVIVDYGMSNLESVKNAVFFLKKEAVISSLAKDLKKADKIIFPGVGHFAKAVYELKKRKLIEPLKAKIEEGTPFLGICLGMQLLFEKSSEAEGVKGLGILKGEVLKFNQKNLIIPHMGWNKVKKVNNHGSKSLSQSNNDLFAGIKDESYFYFAHSYFCRPQNKNLALSYTDYGNNFVSSICRKNLWAVQFHPEKSYQNGLKLLNNFLS